MTTDGIKYINTVIRWTENGETREKILKVEEGISFNFEQSGNKKVNPKPYEYRGNVPVYTVAKEEAYNILGLSLADKTDYTEDKGDKNPFGKDIYILDHRDLENAKHATENQLVQWIGSGGRFVRLSEITSNNPVQNGGLSIVHKAGNVNGNNNQYKISVFYNPKK